MFAFWLKAALIVSGCGEGTTSHWYLSLPGDGEALWPERGVATVWYRAHWTPQQWPPTSPRTICGRSSPGFLGYDPAQRYLASVVPPHLGPHASWNVSYTATRRRADTSSPAKSIRPGTPGAAAEPLLVAPACACCGDPTWATCICVLGVWVANAIPKAVPKANYARAVARFLLTVSSSCAAHAVAHRDQTLPGASTGRLGARGTGTCFRQLAHRSLHAGEVVSAHCGPELSPAGAGLDPFSRKHCEGFFRKIF